MKFKNAQINFGQEVVLLNQTYLWKIKVNMKKALLII